MVLDVPKQVMVVYYLFLLHVTYPIFTNAWYCHNLSFFLWLGLIIYMIQQFLEYLHKTCAIIYFSNC